MKTTFKGTAEIIIKKAKDLLIGDVTALKGEVTRIERKGRFMSLTLKYPSGNKRKHLWKPNQTVRLFLNERVDI